MPTAPQITPTPLPYPGVRILDLSHYQPYFDLNEAVGSGALGGVILKATEGPFNSGRIVTDERFTPRWGMLAQVGVLPRGAYHFSREGNGRDQAEAFMDVVQPGPGDLLCLDWEEVPGSPDHLTLPQAEEFVATVHNTVGRYPWVYVRNGFLQEESIRVPASSILAQCHLWSPAYGPKPPRVPAPWKTWDLWQFSSKALCPGVRTREGGPAKPCDASVAFWKSDELARIWGT